MGEQGTPTRRVVLILIFFIALTIMLSACESPADVFRAISDAANSGDEEAGGTAMPTISGYEGIESGESAGQPAQQQPSDADAGNDYQPAQREFFYTAPTQLGNELGSFNVELDGDLYRLPAPLTVFLDNGWEISKEGLEEIEAYEFGYLAVDLTRGGKTFKRVQLGEINEGVRTIENFFVDGIKNITSPEYEFFGDSNHDIEAVLPGGVTIGTSEREMKSVYKTLLDSGELYIRLENDDHILYEFIGWYGRNVQMYVNNATGLVYNISMQNNQF